LEEIMSLAEWERNGWLTKHETSRDEIRDLLQVVERDLADSDAEGLSADWRLNIAYNAALQAATVALAAAGYRAARDLHHYRVIQSLRETIGVDAVLSPRSTRSGRSGTSPATSGSDLSRTRTQVRCVHSPFGFGTT
jgi:hypothetical protein